MDADYLRNSLGQVVAKGCAETIAVAPVDPIHYLSLWLLKYVENAKLVNEFQKEKECFWQEQRARQDRQRQSELQKTEEIRKQAEKINQIRSIQKDPYLLFGECLKAVLQFTGGTSAYVALVLDKPWQPPKKLSNSEGGDNEPNEEERREVEEEEEEEVEEEGVSVEVNSEYTGHGEDSITMQQEGDTENSGGESKEKIKPLKPPNYKKKILLYVAATPNNEYLINKKLDRKTGPITFTVLLKGLPKLHIANVLYHEGVHFFQGLPLMGAYLTVPIFLNSTIDQVIALLCVDTLRKEHAGTGKPFSLEEQQFIVAVAQAATEVLSTTLAAATSTFDTKSVVKELQDQLQQLELSHKSKSEKREAKQILGNDETQSETRKEAEEEEGKDRDREVHNQVDETESKDLEDVKDDDDADIDEQDGAEDNTEEAKDEDGEELEETEGQEEVSQHDGVDDNQKQMQEVGRSLRQQQRKVAKLQEHFQKCQTRLEKQAAKVAKLEKQLSRSNGTLSHLRSLLTCVVDTIFKHKDEVFGQIKQCLFPSALVYRVLKALLHILGHSEVIIHDWTRSRQALNEDICMGITEESLSEEAPVGYLGQQWLLAAKKVAFETVKCNEYKTKSEKAIKDFADVELEQMVAEIDLRVAIDEEKKLSLHQEDLQSSFAKQLLSRPTDEVAGRNVAEGDEDGEEE